MGRRENKKGERKSQQTRKPAGSEENSQGGLGFYYLPSAEFNREGAGLRN